MPNTTVLILLAILAIVLGGAFMLTQNDALGPSVSTNEGTRVEAPGTRIDSDRDRTRIQAPGVDITIPKDKNGGR